MENHVLKKYSSYLSNNYFFLFAYIGGQYIVMMDKCQH